jgi:hypothetical protein
MPALGLVVLAVVLVPVVVPAVVTVAAVAMRAAVLLLWPAAVRLPKALAAASMTSFPLPSTDAVRRPSRMANL